MRIIAGQLRGRRLVSIKDKGVRPISGRIKQSLFDILTNLIAQARFLDLFAGTGAVGMEALSRGAAVAVFVDRNRRCIETIQENLARGGFSDRGKAQPGDALGDLTWIPYRTGVERFDLVFMGPPYKDEAGRPLSYSTRTLASVAASGLVETGGWVIGQHHVKEQVEPPAGWEMPRREKYGDTFLSFFRVKKDPAA